MSENFEDKLLYEINPIAKIYHCNNIDCLIKRMESGLNEFKEKAPHRKDFIEATENSIKEMGRLKIWIEFLYQEVEQLNRHSIEARTSADLNAARAVHFEEENKKLLKTLDFNEK